MVDYKLKKKAYYITNTPKERVVFDFIPISHFGVFLYIIKAPTLAIPLKEEGRKSNKQQVHFRIENGIIQRGRYGTLLCFACVFKFTTLGVKKQALRTNTF